MYLWDGSGEGRKERARAEASKERRGEVRGARLVRVCERILGKEGERVEMREAMWEGVVEWVSSRTVMCRQGSGMSHRSIWVGVLSDVWSLFALCLMVGMRDGGYLVQSRSARPVRASPARESVSVVGPRIRGSAEGRLHRHRDPDPPALRTPPHIGSCLR